MNVMIMKKARHKSTIVRDNLVYGIYQELREQYGDIIFNNLARSFIYEEISRRTGLSPKTISRKLNHYRIGDESGV